MSTSSFDSRGADAVFHPEEKVWTLVAHDVTSPVAVRGSSLLKPHVTSFNYGASEEQLHAIVTGSEQCQQEVVYNCKKSRLFNTKGSQAESPCHYYGRVVLYFMKRALIIGYIFN
ncbi:Contactin-associated protein like 5-2 [Liparis tanakae]|uniref:Contactin-associated protein like 5-2 n=1 Tax=Liparis tanakae TaxID=230148 RepID=A0A4Z2H7C8_9TELE|nr:Contactin-associated protein like 5-2 [Liparis tanakae]